MRELKRLVPWAEIVHLTGVYSFPTIPTLLRCKLRRKPVVWSPRGGLQRWEGTRRRLGIWFWERACDQLLSPDSSVQDTFALRLRLMTIKCDDARAARRSVLLPGTLLWRSDCLRL